MRRAIIIRSELKNYVKRNEIEGLRPDLNLLKSLLKLGRYRHGARSISAVIELSNITPSNVKFGWDELPEDTLLQLHVDRGFLDSRLIGGAIALSGYDWERGKEDQGIQIQNKRNDTKRRIGRMLEGRRKDPLGRRGDIGLCRKLESRAKRQNDAVLI